MTLFVNMQETLMMYLITNRSIPNRLPLSMKENGKRDKQFMKMCELPQIIRLHTQWGKTESFILPCFHQPSK